MDPKVNAVMLVVTVLADLLVCPVHLVMMAKMVSKGLKDNVAVPVRTVMSARMEIREHSTKKN